VVISAPAKGGEVQTIVLGVNDEELDRRANVFSMLLVLQTAWRRLPRSSTTTGASR